MLIQSIIIYSTSLISNNHLTRVTACLEVKIWSLFLHGNLTTGNKILWKRGEIAPKEQVFLFSTVFFQYISNFGKQITCSFVKCGCSIYFILNSANLICQDTNIWKYFRESCRLRDNESRLYFYFSSKTYVVGTH